MVHKAVLVRELIENLNLKSGSTVVDGTLGAGGHTMAALGKILPGGKLISIDWDRNAVERFRKILFEKGIAVSAKNGKVVADPASVKSNAHDASVSRGLTPLINENKIVAYWSGVNDNYANIKEILRGLGVKTADAVFADLGFSSDQIDDRERGFSFLGNGPLDMRYSPDAKRTTAADIVNGYTEQKLAQIFKDYGEEKYARSIARGIARVRKSREIKDTEDLVEIISANIPRAAQSRNVAGKSRGGSIHFATRVFQALRIEVNGELENLKKFLGEAVGNLASGGRLAIISFHSLEDRIVKNFFREESRDCVCPPGFPKCICGHRRRLKIITKKPIGPGETESRDNPRARSAKLRVAEKV